MWRFSMYTALLVDDEQSVLDILKDTISWQQFGVDTLLTAADGIQALSLLENSAVHLLITDIRMPGMDGIELLTRVRELYPTIRCILLTAYAEFEYAKKALLLGVENYLLKPIQQEELEATIEKALENLYDDHRNSDQLFRDNILTRWVTGTIHEDELSERASILGLNIYHREYAVICMKKIDKCSLSAVYEYLTQHTPSSRSLYGVWNTDGQFILIIGDRSISPDELLEQLNTCMNSLHYRGAFLSAIGSVVSGSSNVSQSYRIANELLETTVYQTDTLILTQESQTEQYKNSLSQDLTVLFGISDPEVRQIGYSQFRDKLFGDNQSAQTAFAILTHSLLQLFERQFPNNPDIRPQLSTRIHLSMSAAASDNLPATIIELLEYSCLLYQYNYEQFSPIIQRTIDYIHTQYSAGISLKEFCVKNKVNTAYLGYLFKKETGMFFNNYLSQYRICSSLRLLENTDMQINDIAETVGFSTPSYFISCFKKQTGLSPIKYRSQF